MCLNKQMNGYFSRYCSLSLICADPLSIRDDLGFLSRYGLKKVHLDIMDASFVPRFGVYPEISSQLEREFDFEFDAHFMVSDLESALSEWFKYQVPKQISYHYSDNAVQLPEINKKIRESGAKAIVAYDLSVTDFEFLRSIEESRPDGIMLLGIVPGVLVQKHQPEAVLRRLRLLRDHCVDYLSIVQIDGGVNFSTLNKFVAEGATELVCGSSTIYKNVELNGASNKFEMLRDNVSSIDGLLRKES